MQGKIPNDPLHYVYPTLAFAKSPLCLVSLNPSGVEWGVEPVDATFCSESKNP